MSRRVTVWTGALLAVVLAAAVFSRFGIDAELRRDEAIYAYAGQQLAEGVPPYVSILDPKTPLATVLAGGAVAVGRGLGVDDLHAIRLAFFVVACLSVLAVYLAGTFLFDSPLAGLLGAATFSAFRGFALDALGGPNAKTPGVLFAALATALLARHHWFWGGFAGSLAGLVWQPLAVYAPVAIAAAWLASDADRRWRHTVAALAGATMPVAATFAYFLAAGAFAEFWEGAVLLPVSGTQREAGTFSEHLQHVVDAVRSGYGASRFAFWAGLAALVVLIVLRVWEGRGDLRRLGRDPLVCVVLPPLALLTAFSLIDFQGYPDLYPFLPYAALGVAGVAAAGLAHVSDAPWRGAARVAAGLAVFTVVVAAWFWYSTVPEVGGRRLPRQRAMVDRLERTFGSAATLYALGDPTPLVLLQRANPSRYIYLAAGVDRWVVAHLPGGFAGWTAGIVDSHPDVILTDGWAGELAGATRSWLREQYREVRIGDYTAFVPRAPIDAAGRLGSAELLWYGP
ncbi:MAG TPA: hypothetical protein VHK63_07630 [Candidatus Limnocylindria bacterium]|nr:hypothetical protein [Candidatus Limnocylindria bacterium]